MHAPVLHGRTCCIQTAAISPIKLTAADNCVYKGSHFSYTRFTDSVPAKYSGDASRIEKKQLHSR